jgi:HEAT repeat protein
VRECAAEALGKIGSAQAVKHLIVALDDGANQVRQAAKTALQVIGTPEALKALGHRDSSAP